MLPRVDAEPGRAGSPSFEPSLEGLRGVASAIVVVRHSFNAMVVAPATRLELAQSPFAVLLNAQGAVQLFFVLSGWVLAGSLARSAEGPPWLRFYARRVARIHLPYLVAVGLALAVAILPRPAGAPTPHPAAPPFGGIAALASYAVFPGNTGNLLPIDWTLAVELVFSFAMPLMLLAARPGRGLVLLAACAAVLFASPWDMPRYALDFALGVVAHRERAAIAAAFARIGAAGRAALVAAGAVLWISPLLLWPVILRGYLLAGWSPVEIGLMGIGSAVLVACTCDVAALRRAFSSPVCQFLGRISYSLYLVHWTAISLFAPRLVDGSAIGNAALLVAVFAASIAVSVPFHRYVEQPAIALGRRLAHRKVDGPGPAPSVN